MSYTIKKTDGTALASVPENAIVLDKASVALIGRGSTNYGIRHSEAFVHLLENFAHTSPPVYPMDGQLWFDKNVGALKVYKTGAWSLIGGGVSGTGSTGSGPVYVAVGSTSVLSMVAGGKVIAVIASQNFAAADLPVTVSILDAQVAFRSRFPYGLEAGYNLADDPEDYVINGHVPKADASIWAGGGNPFAATTFVDLGPYSVALTVSNNLLVAAYSQVAITNANLPTNFTINGLIMPFRAAFPNGLQAGLTLADGMSLGIGGATITGSGSSGGSGGGVTTQVVAEMINAEATARASAISGIYAELTNNYATATITNTLNSTFLSATGQSTLAQAIEYLVTTAGSGTASADYSVALKAEIKNAITGATSFAQALQIINNRVTTDYATSSQLTSLQSNVTNGYTTAIATAVQNLVTQSNLTTSLANLKTQINTEFEAATGYANFAAAITDLSGSSGSGGSTAAFDTDLRTRFTNAMANGEQAGTIQTIAQAMDKFKNFSGSITANTGAVNDLVGALKTLTGTTSQQTTANAVQKLVSDSKLTTALATFKTTLTAEYVSNMNELTGGTGTTFAAAMTDILASATSDGSGSTSSIDTTLRNSFINLTHEPEFPVTTVAQAVTKLMTNTTKDRALSAQVTALEGYLSGAFGVALSNVQQSLTTASQNANAGAQFAIDLKSRLTTTTGTSDWIAGLSYLAAGAASAGTNASAITTLQSQFTSAVPGASNFANAAQLMWTAANTAGSTALWGFQVQAGNKIAGIRAIANSSSSSEIKLRADSFKVYNDDSEFVPFAIESGVVKMHSVEVDKLKNNSAVVPVRSAATYYMYGTYGATSGTPVPSTPVLTATVVMNTPGFIEVNFTCKQAFQGGTTGRPWIVQTFVNDEAIPESVTGGTVPGDSVSTSGAYYASSAGTYVVEIRWNAHNSIIMVQRSLFVKGFPYTS